MTSGYLQPWEWVCLLGGESCLTSQALAPACLSLLRLLGQLWAACGRLSISPRAGLGAFVEERSQASGKSISFSEKPLKQAGLWTKHPVDRCFSSKLIEEALC